jgi:hypothetical protein
MAHGNMVNMAQDNMDNMAQGNMDNKAQEDTDSMVQREPRTHPSLLFGKFGDRSGAADRQDTGHVSTVTVAVTNDRKALSAPVAQANAGNNVVGLPSLCQSGSPVFTPHFYQRLNPPLSHLFKELLVVDGTDSTFYVTSC